MNAAGSSGRIDVSEEIRVSAGNAIERWGPADRLGLLERLALVIEGGARRAA